MTDIKRLRQTILTIRSHLDDLLCKLEPVAKRHDAYLVHSSCAWLDRHIDIIEKEVMMGRKTWGFGLDPIIANEIAESFIKEGCDPKLAYCRSDPLYNTIYKTEQVARQYGIAFEAKELYEVLSRTYRL